MLIIDLHQDIGTANDPGFTTYGQTSLAQVRQAGFSLVCTTTYVRAAKGEYRPLDEEVAAWYEKQLVTGERLVRSALDLPQKEGEPLRLLLVQEGFAVPEPATYQALTKKLDALYSAGVRVLQPVYAGYLGHQKHPNSDGQPSPLGFSAADGELGWKLGLTELGKRGCQLWLEMGGLLDAAHASPAGLEDLAILCQEANRPLLVSHTGSWRYNPHNLRAISKRTCHLLKARLAEGGFLVGVALASTLLGQGDVRRWIDAVQTIANVVGWDQVALGSDLGGACSGVIDGIASTLDIPQLIEAAQRYLTSNQVEKVFGDNALRCLHRALPQS